VTYFYIAKVAATTIGCYDFDYPLNPLRETMRILRILFLVCLSGSLSINTFAEEGLWLYTAVPKPRIKAKYAFDVTDPWLDHLRLSSVRVSDGSGAFVSSDGLVLTNQHIASDCLHDISTAGHDYVKNGFYARKQQEELRCPGFALDVLEQITNVTTRVNAEVKPGMNEADSDKLQRAAIASIEKECAAASKDDLCDVTRIYSGALFYLYRYKKYTDVRLVFAPEFDAAAFGGDADNFEFPRYDLDISFLRAYEDGKPAHPAEYLSWANKGVQEGDLVFVSGNPGSSNRQQTINQLYFLHLQQHPVQLKSLARRINLLQSFSEQSPENARITHEDILDLQNSLKATTGFESAFTDPNLMRRKIMDERIRLIRTQNSTEGRREFVAYRFIDQALTVQHEIFPPFRFLEQMAGFRGQLIRYARTLVRAAEEKNKPDNERLREYRNSALPAIEDDLFSAAPIYKPLEILVLTDSLKEMQEGLGADKPVVIKILEGKTPEEVAKNAISNTQLDNATFRKQLYQGGADAIAKSNDPLIAMMRNIEPDVRALRKRYDTQVETVIRENDAIIAKARFLQMGLSSAPDGNFTLRLSYGLVKGYTEDGRGYLPKGAKIPAFTTFQEAFEHGKEHNNQAPYRLPDSWASKQKNIQANRPLNFVSTADMLGGSSGSPVVNKEGEVVGVIFDGNFQFLPWRFLYDDTVGRAVSVDAQGILEALRKIYKADDLVKELTRKRKTASSKK
jgi:hypothetical protein